MKFRLVLQYIFPKFYERDCSDCASVTGRFPKYFKPTGIQNSEFNSSLQKRQVNSCHTKWYIVLFTFEDNNNVNNNQEIDIYFQWLVINTCDSVHDIMWKWSEFQITSHFQCFPDRNRNTKWVSNQLMVSCAFEFLFGFQCSNFHIFHQYFYNIDFVLLGSSLSNNNNNGIARTHARIYNRTCTEYIHSHLRHKFNSIIHESFGSPCEFPKKLFKQNTTCKKKKNTVAPRYFCPFHLNRLVYFLRASTTSNEYFIVNSKSFRQFKNTFM